MNMGDNKQRIADLRREITRLEAEEFAANAGKRLDDFRDAVSKTGYFRCRQEFCRAKPNTQGWLDDNDLYGCEVLESLYFFYGDGGGASIDVENRHNWSTFDAEDVFPISAAEYEAAKALLASVRTQVKKFISKYKDDE